MSDPSPEAPRPKRPKFKHTRELVRIAVHDGLTQKQIADLCRVEQSVVSNWLNGRSAAFEHQVAELRRRYGGRLNRTTARVYLVREDAPQAEPWDETECGRWLCNLQREVELCFNGIEAEEFHGFVTAERKKEFTVEASKAKSAALNSRVEEALALLSPSLRATIRSDLEPRWNLGRVIEHARSAHDLLRFPERVTVVEGPVVFRYSFVEYRPRLRGRESVPTPVPIARWCVHQIARDRLLLVQQRRRVLTGLAKERWEKLRRPWEVGQSNGHWTAILGDQQTFEVEAPDDSARWIASLRAPVDAEALVDWCDAYLADTSTVHDPRDEAALPFLLRKALVEQGYALKGVVRIVASE